MKKLLLSIAVCVFFCDAQVVSAQISKKRGSDNVKIGIAAYTFREFDIDSTLRMYQIAGAKYMSVKDFHLPLNSTKEEMEVFKKKCAAYGVVPYALGPIYMRSKADVDTSFDYAVRFGSELLVCVPDYELLPYVEQKVKETGIRIAIHTHGPDIPLYPDAQDAYNKLKNRDPRMGICIDLGHTVRLGKDSSKDLLKYKDRIFDIHIKDVTADTKKGGTCEMGRGVMDFKPILEAIKKIKYDGVVSLEYEKDGKYPFFGVLESIGYLRGALDMIYR